MENETRSYNMHLIGVPGVENIGNNGGKIQRIAEGSFPKLKKDMSFQIER